MTKKKLVIAISGPPGVGTSTISKEVAKRLNLRYFSPGSYYKKLFGKENVNSVVKGWETELGSSEELHRRIDEMQIIEAKKGNVVICGKLSFFFLKDLARVKIWLDAPLDVRARRTAERDGISLEDAKEKIRKRERSEREGWKKIYGIDYFQLKKMADLVLDTSNLSVKETVERVMEFIKKKLSSK